MYDTLSLNEQFFSESSRRSINSPYVGVLHHAKGIGELDFNG